MKITLDTNILISGSFWKGASYHILSLVEQGIVELVLSEQILNEYYETLQDEEIKQKITDKNLMMLDIMEKVIKEATIVKPTMHFDAVAEDRDDNIILECAVEGEVDYIITKDRHLLKLIAFKDIPIITPEDFLASKID